MKTLGIYSHHTAMFTIATMLYIIALVFISLVTGSLYLLTAFTQFLLPACPPPLITANLISFSMSVIALNFEV